MSAPRKNFSNRGHSNNRQYGNRQQANYRTQVDFGVRGFFVTVEGNMTEKPAVREVYNLFDTLVEQNDKSVDEPKTESVVDASDELAAACAEVKNSSSQNNKGSQHRLRQVPTNVRNCLFFQTELPVAELYEAADKIVDSCQATNSCRFVARFIPVEFTTGTELDHIMKGLERVIHYHFVETWKGTKSPTYALEFKARNNDSIRQKDILSLLDDLIQTLTPGSRVNLSNPDLAVLVNVLHKNVLLSCCKRYSARRKFSTRPPQEKKETPVLPAGDQQKTESEETS